MRRTAAALGRGSVEVAVRLVLDALAWRPRRGHRSSRRSLDFVADPVGGVGRIILDVAGSLFGLLADVSGGVLGPVLKLIRSPFLDSWGLYPVDVGLHLERDGIKRPRSGRWVA